METSALRSHTAQIITVTVTSDRKLRYSRARVMLKYRSKEISVILRMEAVHNNTSVAEWTWKLWTWHQDSGRHLTLVNDFMNLNFHMYPNGYAMYSSNVVPNVFNVMLILFLWLFNRLSLPNIIHQGSVSYSYLTPKTPEKPVAHHFLWQTKRHDNNA